MSQLRETRDALEKRADELRALEPDWDTYGGKTVNEEALVKGIELGVTLAPLFSDQPYLVPCSDGSVQVEWHCDGYEVEVFVARALVTAEKS